MLFSLVALGGQSSSSLPPLQGLFTDWRQTYSGGKPRTSGAFVSDATGEITLVGSDDGVRFWTLFGRYIDRKKGQIVVDFSPKGGPKDLPGVFHGDQIQWGDGNMWARESCTHDTCFGWPPPAAPALGKGISYLSQQQAITVDADLTRTPASVSPR